MPRRAPRQTPYLWIPGQGYDQAALSRLQRAFPRPAEPMGGGLVMSGDRHVFDDLLGDLTLLSTKDLQTPLEEIASGTSAFGPLDEWTDWYHYLLAQLIPHSHDTHVFHALLEILVTGFITQHPDGPKNAPYAGFFDDALDTLGRCLMDQACWPDGEIDVEACLGGAERWFEATGKLSASMFFCLKYLAPDAIAPWLKSVLSVPDIHWRAELIRWFVGAHGLLDGPIRQISELDERTETPAVDWDGRTASKAITQATTAATRRFAISSRTKAGEPPLKLCDRS